MDALPGPLIGCLLVSAWSVPAGVGVCWWGALAGCLVCLGCGGLVACFRSID